MRNEVLIAVGCVVVVLLICFITALVHTKKGRMVISSGTGDKCLLIISPILAVVSWCFMDKNQVVCLILLSISGFLLLGSLIHAVRNNWGHFGFVLLSLLAKIAIFVFTFLAILVLLGVTIHCFTPKYY